MIRRLLLVGALLASALPTHAKGIPQAELDALAQLTLAPRLCNLDTKQTFFMVIQRVSKEHGVSIPRIGQLIGKVHNFWIVGFATHPEDVPKFCQAMRRLKKRTGT